jgi:hypothetical protein
MDSLKMIFYISDLNPKPELVESLPVFNSCAKKGNEKIRDYVLPQLGISPLTKAKFKIKALAYITGEAIYIRGYEIEVNIPACAIGNNLMLENDMDSSCQIALLLLCYWLLKSGCCAEAILLFSLENSTIISVTPTFLVRFPSRRKAVAALRKVKNHARLIHNLRFRKTKLMKNPVLTIDDDNSCTWYINRRNYHLRSYIVNPLVKAT